LASSAEVRPFGESARVARTSPGLLSALDLPMITGAGLVRPVPGPSPDSRMF
jgi:2,4-diaminopentanoate dehydrogenase